MLGLIPLICLAAIIWTVHQWVRRQSGIFADWRISVLAGAAVWGGILYVLTELLSLLYAIQFAWVLPAWLVVLAATAKAYFKIRSVAGVPAGGKGPSSSNPGSASKKTARKSDRATTSSPNPDRMNRRHVVMLALAATIVICVFLIAIVSPPNTWDSMTYHLPRIEHWIQNGSVEHYPTHIIRQLYLNPYAEYVILHLRLLGGNDYLANLVQFGSMLGSLVAVSFIARLLGSRLLGQTFAVVLCASLPMGILQASSTQTDYVTSFWLATLVVFLLLLRQRASMALFGLAGLALGLALLTKALSFIFGAPFALWLAVEGIRQLRWRAWKPALLVAAICLVVNGPFLMRNMQTFGTLTEQDRTPTGKSLVANEMITPSSVGSNILRNHSLHLVTPDEDVNRAVEKTILKLHEWMGIAADDPRTTFMNRSFGVSRWAYDEDLSGNPLHLLLALAALVMILARPSLRRRRDLLIYSACLFGGFVLFCAYLRWQPWHSRLHLPLFVLGTAVIAAALDDLRHAWIGLFLVAAVAVSACPWVTSAYPRYLVLAVLGAALCAAAMDRIPKAWMGIPLVLVGVMLLSPWTFEPTLRPMFGPGSIFNRPREELYFNHMSRLSMDMHGGLSRFCDQMRIQGTGHLGIISASGDMWEYPLWILMRQRMDDAVRIDHVRVANPSGRLWGGRFGVNSSEPPPPMLMVVSASNSWRLVFTDGRTWPLGIDGH